MGFIIINISPLNIIKKYSCHGDITKIVRMVLIAPGMNGLLTSKHV